MFEIVFKL